MSPDSPVGSVGSLTPASVERVTVNVGAGTSRSSSVSNSSCAGRPVRRERCFREEPSCKRAWSQPRSRWRRNDLNFIVENLFLERTVHAGCVSSASERIRGGWKRSTAAGTVPWYWGENKYENGSL